MADPTVDFINTDRRLRVLRVRFKELEAAEASARDERDAALARDAEGPAHAEGSIHVIDVQSAVREWAFAHARLEATAAEVAEAVSDREKAEEALKKAALEQVSPEGD